jgi:ribosomal protein S18 acetylase RimI-like enzyme
MIIRQADIQDALAIATIHVRSWQYAYRDLLPGHQLDSLSIPEREQQWLSNLDPACPLETVVLEKNGKVVGFANWGLDPDSHPATAVLYSMYLDPSVMGKGYGSALMQAVEVDMIAAGATKGTLHVLAANTPTRKFYENHAWRLEPDSHLTENFFGIDVDTVVYSKSFA